MKPQFEVSPDTRKLADFLQTRDAASYAEMNRRIGRQVNGPDRYVLYAALRRLQREHEIVFVVERGVGIRRATNGQIATLSTDHPQQRTRRLIRRAKKLSALVNTQGLTDDRQAFFVGLSINQILESATARKMKSKIAKEIEERGGEQVDVTDVIALFAKRAH